MITAHPRRLALLLAALPWAASAQYLGNFDAVNNTGRTAHGFEIELEGLSSADITDEASAIERLGLCPRLVRGDASNFKVTYAQDIRLAAALLSAGQN